MSQSRGAAVNSSSRYRREHDAGRPSIVVVEDNPTDVFLVREAIAAHGLNADLELLEDGEAALGLIARLDADESAACPHLMLLDLNLPKTDGFEVLERLRASKRCAGMRVVVMSSSAAPSDRNKSTALGAVAYFQKRVQYDASMEIGGIIKKLLAEEA